jgi:hypothetical protein
LYFPVWGHLLTVLPENNENCMTSNSEIFPN